MSGKLIVFEGTDGSGKATQTALLCRELESRGVPFRKLEFPRYKEESSALLRLYLSGAFGTDPADVNAYAAATFFSVDRYASFKQDWGGWYRQGGLVIADRYTTSNAVHQTSKLPPQERQVFLDWLFDFEYRKLGLPGKPAGHSDLHIRPHRGGPALTAPGTDRSAPWTTSTGRSWSGSGTCWRA